ncbi:MAG: MarR family winged helix-turn-helix transcriptional regulator [Alphaproteobacteria bacterium]|nr:MarR family winged helix-turn-helix transcriptional regulator [Alphaproteobacteria bacterium]MBU0795228.1 MarR family winged helix-turn-helix transcriptional regulator [Alphaproteobacteria bacterium]MBU0876670.1 MarR family winged helix-turn-helix transcriptional regulator [Alphaproteobacteria bacterium]MBU1769372.1 MarR family winged helix-turn-helix transcriptional regulator [Alphaproteobacteria bacterium]
MSQPIPPRSYDELESYLPYLVNRLANLGQATQNRMLHKDGINLVTLRALSILNIEDGLTINEIAARTFTEQSSTSRAIEAMASQGLVERRIPEQDQRRREIVLTDKGREQLLQTWPAMNHYFDMLNDGLSAAERDMCRKVLTRMLANLTELNG